MILQVRSWTTSRGPWNAISCDWEGGPTLKSLLFEIPGHGLHLFTVRAQLYRVRKAATARAKAPGESWTAEPSPANTVAQFNALFAGDHAALDKTFVPGFAPAVAILAADPRLTLECLHAVLGARNPVARRNRAQALLGFPLLISILTMRKQPSLSIQFMPDKVAAVIDRGDPLIPALAKVFGCKPWVWRRLRRLTVEDVQPYTSLRAVAEDISLMPPDRAPGPHGFPLLSLLTNISTHQLLWLQNVARRSVISGGWPELGMRVARLPQINDYARFVASLRTALPNVFIPDPLTALDRLLGSPTLAQLDTLSQRWHRIEEFVRTNILSDQFGHRSANNFSWRPLFADAVMQEGLTLRCLCDRASLSAEGHWMRHCVASYANRCAAGHSHIVSIARGNQRLATAELVLLKQGREIQVMPLQLSGFRNSACSSEARRALLALIAQLPQSHLETFELSQSEAAPAPRDDMATECFLEAVHRQGDEALELYRPCLRLSKSKSLLWDGIWDHFRDKSPSSLLRPNRVTS